MMGIEMKSSVLALAVALFASSASVASAAPTVITSIAGPTVVIDFSGAANEAPITNQYAAQGVTFSGSLFGMTNIGDTKFFPGPPTAIASNWTYDTSPYLQGLTFEADFTSHAFNVGFYQALNSGDFLTATVFDGATNLGSVDFPSPWGGFDVTFQGVSNDVAFDRVVFTVNKTDNGFFAMNDFTFDAAPGVPEPASWAMMLVGFGSIGAVLRRRRTSAPVAA